MRPTLLLLIIVLLAPSPATAGSAVLPRVSEEQVRQFLRDRLADSHTLLLGPKTPHAATVHATDCRELYQRRVALMRGQLDYQQPFWDEPRHGAAVFVGALWTPAFYYLPYRALSTTLARERRTGPAAELDQLRAAAAAARCFEP